MKEKFEGYNPKSVDRRRLRTGAEALSLPEPKTLKEMETQLQELRDGMVALQSTDDQDSPEANQQIFDDMIELERRAKSLERKIKQLKNKK